MTTMSPEQYAKRVHAALVRHMKHDRSGRVADLPSPDDAAQLILQTRGAPRSNPLADRIGPVWSSTRTREALGLNSRQALSSRRANGTVLGLTTADGKVAFPVSQFRRRDATTDVHPALVPVLKVLKDVDSWTVAAMLRSTDPDLGMSPIEWVADGRDAHELEQWARTVERELTAQ